MTNTASNTINLTSLKLVRDELLATIENSAGKLEQFVGDRDNGELLQGCIDGIKQISGTLAVVQLRGADLLAQEILALAQEITTGVNQESDDLISALTSSFFLLPRYLEYVLQTKRNMPVLLIPAINELRSARKEAPLPESHFFSATLNLKHTNAGSASVLAEDVSALARRLRHMYQVGLLAVLQARQVKPSLGMMQRALERMDIICAGRPLSKMWHLGALAIGTIAEKGMDVSRSRKMLLSALDKEFRQLQKAGNKGLEKAPEPALLTELLYLVAVSGSQNPEALKMMQQCNVAPLGYTDVELRREREALRGPSANTISSMAAVLKDELNSVKDVMERASQAGGWSPEEGAELASNLGKIAEILSVVGLVSASSTLREEIERINGWLEAKKNPEGQELLSLADALLYVESTVSGLGNLNLSDDQLARINAGSRNEIIATNQLAEAELLVFQEAEAGLALIKRALSSFSESGFDRGHIKNVSTTLATIRGGMGVIGLKRAAAVTGACQLFVSDSLQTNEHPEMLQQMLETFADAIIGLEYYLDAAKADKTTDDGVLQFAEESLEALGYPVS